MTGCCRTVCSSRKKKVNVAKISTDDLSPAIFVWCLECDMLVKLDCVLHVKIFGNTGMMMGCSDSHLYGQVWSLGTLAEGQRIELDNPAAYGKLSGLNDIEKYVGH